MRVGHEGSSTYISAYKAASRSGCSNGRVFWQHLGKYWYLGFRCDWRYLLNNMSPNRTNAEIQHLLLTVMLHMLRAKGYFAPLQLTITVLVSSSPLLERLLSSLATALLYSTIKERCRQSCSIRACFWVQDGTSSFMCSEFFIFFWHVCSSCPNKSALAASVYLLMYWYLRDILFSLGATTTHLPPCSSTTQVSPISGHLWWTAPCH